MDITTLTLTETKNGVRIHRDTCKKARNTAPLAKVIDFAPGTVVRAKAAACCKPKGVDEVIASLDLSQDDAVAAEVAAAGAKHFTPHRPDEDTSNVLPFRTSSNKQDFLPLAPADEVDEDPYADGPIHTDAGDFHRPEKTQAELIAESESLEAKDEPVFDGVTVPFAGMAKKFWSIARDGAIAVYGGTADNKALTLTVSDENTAEDVKDLWVEANTAFHTWKHTSEQYKSLPKGEKWGRDEMYRLERDFIRDFFQSRAGLI